MRRLFLIAWLLVPVAAAAYHFGPGQERMLLDDAARQVARADQHLRTAERLAADGNAMAARSEWAAADAALEEALRVLPSGNVAERRALRVERAKAQMNVSRLPEANDDLARLVEEMAADPAADPALLAEARDAYASSQYYVTWLMRLEGLGREAWEPEIEVARQTWKLLAEQAEAAGDAGALRASQEDLEAAILLARLDLDELQGLPLPSQ